ncbi:MAG: hypothetical protein JST80_11145 [Bdellovibrionales bacterium]|nr:hypothetical protein [Bdellovibrionales bacterium]
MHSFIYFYSKFTEEFLLLGGAGIFTLLSAYCYHWVIKRRRLGAARSQVPSGVVKAYLNQLINEAQFVRTQLFGLLGNEAIDPNKIQNLFALRGAEAGVAPAADGSVPFNVTSETVSTGASFSGAPGGGVPGDLFERLKALEGQLVQKETLVVNINVEKTRLLEEIENLKQNQKALQNSNAMSAGQDELLKKIKNLEERLEEYALFEDDLANLKRLQQENNTLKKRLEDNGMNATVIPASAAEPVVETVIPGDGPSPKEEKQTIEAAKKSTTSLDKKTIDTLLDGESPIATAEPKIEPTVAPKAAVAAGKEDNFEKLVDSVENSLGAKPGVPGPTLTAVPSPATEATAKPEAKAAAPSPAAEKAASAAPASAAPASAAPTVNASPVSEKSDEELLKEFENLLNS